LPNLVVKDQSDKQKSWKTKTYKISKIGNPILIEKSPQEKKDKKNRKKSKLLEDIHEESLEDCPSW